MSNHSAARQPWLRSELPTVAGARALSRCGGVSQDNVTRAIMDRVLRAWIKHDNSRQGWLLEGNEGGETTGLCLSHQNGRQVNTRRGWQLVGEATYVLCHGARHYSTVVYQRKMSVAWKEQYRVPAATRGRWPALDLPFPVSRAQPGSHPMAIEIKEISGETAGMGARCMKACLQRAALSGSMGSNQRC